MKNEELKIKFDKVQTEIEQAKKDGKNLTNLLKEKIELLQIGYEKLTNELTDEKYDKNPKKYSTLLAFLNNIKNIQQELAIPTSETDNKIAIVHEKMNNNGLGWLLKK